MERIGIYTGTFNPVHLGHLRAARYAREALRLDRVLLIPDGLTPHKTLPRNSPTGQQRLDMLTMCLETEEGLTCSDMALCREGVSYTWQTVTRIREAFPDAELFLLMGSDMLDNLHQWRGVEEIFRNAAVLRFL